MGERATPEQVDPVVARLRAAVREAKELAAVQAPLAAPMIERVLRGVEADITMLLRFWEDSEAQLIEMVETWAPPTPSLF